MATFVIFNRESGEVVHTHFEPTELRTPPEEILQFALEPSQIKQHDILQIPDDEIKVGRSFRVDVKNKRLLPDDKAASGGGHVTRGDEYVSHLPRKYSRQE